MAQNKEIPVYLFTGFIDSGKTKFIQETLEDKRFNNRERTLLLICEEGDEEYCPDTFSSPNVFCEIIENQKQLNPDKLSALAAKHNVDRVIVEYNGMWQVTDLYAAIPENWMVYQEMTFADGSLFMNYNANMRSLVVDKIMQCDMIAFNRVPVGSDVMPLHQIVRGLSRRAEIVYEFADGKVQYDEIEDPLPFDKEADVIKIEDRDFALFFRDLMEAMGDYNQKTVEFKGVVARGDRFAADTLMVGRHIMTCCQDDIAYNGLVALTKDATKYKNYDWVTVKGKISIEKNKLYRAQGPVLKVISITPALKPEQEVATFY